MATQTLPTFSPRRVQPKARGFMSDASAAVDVSGWETIKPAVAPYVWAWYDQHKDQKITRLFGFYTVRVGSFGIAEMVLTAIFGSRPLGN